MTTTQQIDVGNTLIIGAPGSGKSVAIFERLDQIRALGQPAIVYDKTGAYTEKFYREGVDILLNPFDARCPSWNIFKELRLSFDVIKIAEALIEQPISGEKFWSANARILFADLVRKLDEAGLNTNADLNYYANKLPLAKLHKFLEGTHGGTLVDPKSEKAAIGIRAELGNCMAAWPFLKDDDDAFSLREFIADCDEPDTNENEPDTNKSDRWVFITSVASEHSLMKPLISLWLEIVCSGILYLPPRANRRIHLVIDEIASLQKLPSLHYLMAEGRGQGRVVIVGLHLFSQLANVYGNDLAELMLGLSKSLVVLQTTEQSTAKLLSDRLGILEGEIHSFPVLTGVIKIPDMPVSNITLKPKFRPSIAEKFVAPQRFVMNKILVHNTLNSIGFLVEASQFLLCELVIKLDAEKDLSKASLDKYINEATTSEFFKFMSETEVFEELLESCDERMVICLRALMRGLVEYLIPDDLALATACKVFHMCRSSMYLSWKEINNRHA